MLFRSELLFDPFSSEHFLLCRTHLGNTQHFSDPLDQFLGGQLKTGNLWTGQNRHFLPAAETNEFYFVPSSVRKSVWTFVRQLRGPHLSTCAWWSSRSSSAVTAAVSLSSLPQSSTGRFDVKSVDARS